MRTTTFKFYDTSSLLVMGSELFDNRFAISSITLEELESIKVSANKDSDIKYATRQLFGLDYEEVQERIKAEMENAPDTNIQSNSNQSKEEGKEDEQ